MLLHFPVALHFMTSLRKNIFSFNCSKICILNSIQPHTNLICFCHVLKVIIRKGFSPPGTHFKAASILGSKSWFNTKSLMKEKTVTTLSLNVTYLLP